MIVAIGGLVCTLAACIAPKLIGIVDEQLSRHFADTTLPKFYQADAPGPGCDKGGASWTLLKGKVTCTGQHAVYEGARVQFDWRRRAFPPAYEIILHADALGPMSCILMVVHDKYGVSTCTGGGVQISRLNPKVTTIAAEPTGKFTQTQIMVRVDEHKLTLTVFTFDKDDVITLTVDGDAYGSGGFLGISVAPPDDEPDEHATATLYDFQYRAIS